MKEEWKDIEELKGRYQISSFGRVKSLYRRFMVMDKRGYKRTVTVREKILKLQIDKKGYEVVKIERKTYKIHRLVALAFIENPNNLPQVNHIDGNKTNNNIQNLEWVTNSENQLHAYKNGLSVHSEKSGKEKRKVCQLDLNTGKIINIFNSIAEAEKYFNNKNMNISGVCNGKRKSCLGYGWKDFEEGDEVDE